MHPRISALTLAVVALAAACSTDSVVAPVTKVAGKPAFQVSVAKKSKHIVLLKTPGSIPAAFASKVAALGGTVASAHAGAGFAIVSGLSADGAAQLAAAGFGDVQPDFSVALDIARPPIRADASEIKDDNAHSAADPTTASRYNRQWNMRLINAPSAWAAGKLGSSDVTVAILDTGIDYDLPDLNGRVDLSRSKSFMDTFVGNEDDPSTPDVDESDPIVPSDDFLVTHIGLFAGRNLISDLNGHGTNVATQVSSNAVRYAGVTSKTKLIGVKVLGANGVGDFADILNGVLWAADHGADVANMSLGGGFSKKGNGQAIAAINQVFNYARKKGVVMVVSAGNASTDLKHNGNVYSTFCDAPHVICVSAVGPRLATSDPNEPAFYSNFGKNQTDVGAPGGNADAANGFTVSLWPWGPDIASWVWSYCSKTSLIIERNETDPSLGDLFLTTCFANLLNNGYIGTSQAAPHVAGLAALLIAENGKGNPDKIKKLIQKQGAPIDKAYGRSRIDVKAALRL